MPAVIRLMRDHFTGDPALIPDMPDENMAVNRIPFDLFTPGASSRYTVLDGDQYLAVPDVIKSITGKNSNDSSRVWHDLPVDKKEELLPFLKEFKFTGALCMQYSKWIPYMLIL